jgi:hypothetical protein
MRGRFSRPCACKLQGKANDKHVEAGPVLIEELLLNPTAYYPTRPAPAIPVVDLQKSQQQSSAAAVGFCPLRAVFFLRFLALCKIAYQVIGWCNAIDAVDKSDWPVLPCPLCVRVTP